MTPLTNQQIGICTKCLTVHVTETDFYTENSCDNCGKHYVFSVETLCDMANELLSAELVHEEWGIND